MQADLAEGVLDLAQRSPAEVRDPEEVGLGLVHQVVDVLDAGTLKAVGATDVERKHLDGKIQRSLHPLWNGASLGGAGRWTHMRHDPFCMLREERPPASRLGDDLSCRRVQHA